METGIVMKHGYKYSCNSYDEWRQGTISRILLVAVVAVITAGVIGCRKIYK